MRIGIVTFPGTCDDRDKTERRKELVEACAETMGNRWTMEDHARERMCAYEAVVGLRGMDDLQRFEGATRLRESARLLYDNPSEANLCNLTDSALLCIGHQAMRSSKTFLPYLTVDMFSDPFLDVAV